MLLINEPLCCHLPAFAPVQCANRPLRQDSKKIYMADRFTRTCHTRVTRVNSSSGPNTQRYVLARETLNSEKRSLNRPE